MAHFPENFPWGAASERSEDIEAARKKMFSRPEGFGGFSHHDLLDPLCLEDDPRTFLTRWAGPVPLSVGPGLLRRYAGED